MASLGAVLWSFYCFLYLIRVVTVENRTSHMFNTTAVVDSNVTYNLTEYYNTPPAALELTTTTSTNTNTEPDAPLPVTGRLLTPVTKVDWLCPCDDVRGACDINCCCDTDCGRQVALFTDCSLRSVSVNKHFCSRDVASYTLEKAAAGYSVLQSSVQKETSYDIFCIQTQNYIDGFSHPSPALPTDSNFDWIFKQFTSFVFGLEDSSSPASTAELQASPGYQYGDVMMTAGDSGQRGMFWLPSAGVTADCVDSNPAAFLRDHSSQCSRRVVLGRDCNTLPALNKDTYTNIQVFAGKDKDAVVVPVDVASVVLQSLSGTQTELSVAGGENLRPSLLNPDLCANVLLKVTYVVRYNPAGQVVRVTASLVLGFVRGAALPLNQEFHMNFVQQGGAEGPVQLSGNPGYVVGLPLVSGTKTAEYPCSFGITLEQARDLFTGIVRSAAPGDSLSLLLSAEDQDCLQGPRRRAPVRFGVDSASGCTLRLEDAANCSLVSQQLLDVLRGPGYPQYVASFGNSPSNNLLDWVQIQNSFSPEASQSCSIPVSLHLEIEWTKYGSLVNPQPQIVNVREVIQTNGSILQQHFLPISSSVAFRSAAAAASPGFRAAPTVDAKLPFDFFFPFV